MRHIKEFDQFINENFNEDLLNEAKIKTDKKSYDELSQAIDKAGTTEDIWNQLDPKLFPIEFDEFEIIFDKWWDKNARHYDSIKGFAKNATKSDVESLLVHIAKNKK
jgi:hypothetical protein